MENDPLSFKISTCEIDIKERHLPHYNDEIEILYVTDGQLELVVNNQAFIMHPGDFAMLLPFHVHATQPLDLGSTRAYYCHFSMGLLLYSSATIVMQKYIKSIQNKNNIIQALNEEERNAAERIFISLIEEGDSIRPFSCMMSVAILTQLMLLYERKYVENNGDCSNKQHNLNWDIFEFIHLHYNEDLNTDNVSKEFNITKVELNSILYSLTGNNFSYSLHRIRILMACSMMQFDNLSNNYIGTYVGYSTNSAFYRKFKEIKNMTPEEYRNNHSLPNNEIKAADISWKILLYIYENYSLPLDEDMITQYFFISKSNLNSIFQKNFNLTFCQALTNVRLLFARSLLLAFDTPIIHIAHSCGFQSLRTFNRCFKDTFKQTPSAYRNKSEASV